MQALYSDILSLTAKPPRWYDQNGVPRYCEFHPHYCPDILSPEVALLRIACRHCGQEFEAEVHAEYFGRLGSSSSLHYGDPPAHSCVGDSMNCRDLAVLQVWRRQALEWLKVEG